MNAIRRQLRRLRRGFTLVEVSLALLVLSVGVLTAYALFPEGLNAGKAASQDTHAALFADIVFRSYRSASTFVPWNSLNTYRIAVPGNGTVWNGTATTAQIIPSSSPTVQTTYRNQVKIGGQDVDELAIRYNLQLKDIPSTRRKAISLYVWPGLYGPADAASAQYYYTELYNTR